MTALTLKEAKALIVSAEKRADEIGQPVNIAVVDAGGNPVAHVRQDGAWIGGVDISINKAWTSRAFDIQTKDLGENSQPNRQFYGIHATNGGRVIIFAGGVPLKRDGVVVGADWGSAAARESKTRPSPKPASRPSNYSARTGRRMR
jgi:uncharacterized protein GlcG (DUF336 family)